MKIINKVTNEVIATILGGNNMTTDEAIEFVGEIINDANDEKWSDDGDNVIINEKRYWFEDLDTIGDNSKGQTDMNTIKDLRTASGMTQKAFAEYFSISKRAIESWEGEKRECPDYLLRLIHYKLIKEGLIKE